MPLNVPVHYSEKCPFRAYNYKEYHHSSTPMCTPLANFNSICNQCSEDLIDFFNRAEDIYATYWMDGLFPDSYLESSIKVYFSMRFSKACRYDSHFNHSNKHRTSVNHECKQPRLYTAAGQSIRLIRLLQRIEVNVISQCKLWLNIAGNSFQCIKHSCFAVIL